MQAMVLRSSQVDRVPGRRRGPGPRRRQTVTVTLINTVFDWLAQGDVPSRAVLDSIGAEAAKRPEADALTLMQAAP